MANWRLFIDETGDFDSDGEHVAVVGWMVRWDDEACRQWTARARVQVGAALEATFPPLLYPPHAAVLNWTSAFLASWMLRDRERTIPDLPTETERSLELLEASVTASADPRCVAFCLAVRAQMHRWPHERRLPPVAVVGPVDLWLGARVVADPGLVPARGFLREAQEKWKLQSRFVIDQLPSKAKPGEVPCFAIAAVSRAYSWQRGPRQESTDDRYLDLLVVLFERLLHLLRTANSPPATVDVRLLVRDVSDSDARREFTVADVERALALARRSRFKHGSPDAQINVHGVNSWGPDTHVGLVIADQLAWRLYRTLGEPTWYRLKSRWGGLTATPLEYVPRSMAIAPATLPSLAVDGAVRDALEASFTSPQPAPPIAPAWVHEQANRWINALPNLTG